MSGPHGAHGRCHASLEHPGCVGGFGGRVAWVGSDVLIFLLLSILFWFIISSGLSRTLKFSFSFGFL